MTTCEEYRCRPDELEQAVLDRDRARGAFDHARACGACAQRLDELGWWRRGCVDPYAGWLLSLRLEDVLAGRAPRITRHLDACEACRRVVAAAREYDPARAREALERALAALPPGERDSRAAALALSTGSPSPDLDEPPARLELSSLRRVVFVYGGARNPGLALRGRLLAYAACAESLLVVDLSGAQALAGALARGAHHLLEGLRPEVRPGSTAGDVRAALDGLGRAGSPVHAVVDVPAGGRRDAVVDAVLERADLVTVWGAPGRGAGLRAGRVLYHTPLPVEVPSPAAGAAGDEAVASASFVRRAGASRTWLQVIVSAWGCAAAPPVSCDGRADLALARLAPGLWAVDEPLDAPPARVVVYAAGVVAGTGGERAAAAPGGATTERAPRAGLLLPTRGGDARAAPPLPTIGSDGRGGPGPEAPPAASTWRLVATVGGGYRLESSGGAYRLSPAPQGRVRLVARTDVGEVELFGGPASPDGRLDLPAARAELLEWYVSQATPLAVHLA